MPSSTACSRESFLHQLKVSDISLSMDTRIEVIGRHGGIILVAEREVQSSADLALRVSLINLSPAFALVGRPEIIVGSLSARSSIRSSPLLDGGLLAPGETLEVLSRQVFHQSLKEWSEHVKRIDAFIRGAHVRLEVPVSTGAEDFELTTSLELSAAFMQVDGGVQSFGVAQTQYPTVPSMIVNELR